MDGCRTVPVTFPLKVNGHAPVSVYAIMFMVNFPDLLLYLLFLRIIIRLPVFPVVVISIWEDIQPAQEPADTKFFFMLVDKPISL